MTKRDIGKLLGVSGAKLDKLIALGIPSDCPAKALEFQVRRQRQCLKQRDGSDSDGVGAEIRKERSVYFRAQAHCVEIETSREQGELVNFDKWETDAYANIVEARQNLLLLARRVAYGLWGKEPSKILARLREEVDFALSPLVVSGMSSQIPNPSQVHLCNPNPSQMKG